MDNNKDPLYPIIKHNHHFRSKKLKNGVLITIYKKNKNIISENVIYFFCGYDDYFFHLHFFKYTKIDFDIFVIDIPGFGFNKKYDINNPYQLDKKYNYYDDIDNINKLLDKTFKYLKKSFIYKYNILYGYSAGGNIIINYLYHLSQLNDQSILNNLLKFDKIILNSPLTRFYIDNRWQTYIFRLIINFLFYIGYNIDINKYINGTNLKNIRVKNLNKALNNIWGTDSIDYIDPTYKSNIVQPKLVNWLYIAESSILNIKKKIKSTKKLDYNVSLICSEKYGKFDYNNNDDVLNPDDMIEDCQQIFNSDTLQYKKYQTGHDCLLKHQDNISYINILDDIFNDKKI